jgi:hypothetical protein
VIEVRRESTKEIGDGGYAALAAHGFSAEDAWDLGSIRPFPALPNRMANLFGTRPNDEFFLIGRVPRVKPDSA